MPNRPINLGHPAIGLYQDTEAFAALENLGSHGLQIEEGFDDIFLDQLIEKSKEPHIIATTPRDGAEYFTDHRHFESWAKASPNRNFYVLHQGLELAGAAWFTPAISFDLDSPRLAFSIRLYHGYAGRGLARSFMSAIHGRIANSALAINGIKLEADRKNTPAIRAYSRFGYTALRAADPSQNRIGMVLSSERLMDLIATKPNPGA